MEVGTHPVDGLSGVGVQDIPGTALTKQQRRKVKKSQTHTGHSFVQGEEQGLHAFPVASSEVIESFWWVTSWLR
eukprot:3680211-Prorocentrum_lima.AAC.1